jgi:hypothetical protein
MRENAQRNLTRRNALKALGIASAGTLSVAGTATAADADPGAEIQALLEDANYDRAEEVATEYGGSLNTNEVQLSPEEFGGSTGGISSDNFWSAPADSPSSLSVGISEGSWIPADYRIHANWDLNEDDMVLEGYHTCPPDAAALFWNGNYFVPPESGVDNFYGNDRVSYNGMETYNGILADVNDPWPARDGSQNNWSSSFATDLNAVQPDAYKYPIAMEYQHTYIDTAYNVCGSLNVSFSLGPGSISMDGGPQGWSDAAQNSI